MRQSSVASLYREVFAYCERVGLIRRLKKSFAISETHRYKKMRISKDGLHLLDAVHCLYDKPRTNFFLNEIKRFTKPKSVVLEAGVGTGILSFAAATRAKKVYAFEINTRIYRLAQSIEKELRKKQYLSGELELKKADATKATIPEKADIIVSENLYTGMFFEQQVQIVNHLRKYLAPNAVVIPSGLRSYVVLSETTFPHEPKHKELFVPSPERHMDFRRKELSRSVEYDTLDFTKRSKRGVRTSLRIPVTATGVCNSLIIFSEVDMPSGVTIGRRDTTFLNSDIIIALPPKEIKKGDIVQLTIQYEYGAKPHSAVLRAV